MNKVESFSMVEDNFCLVVEMGIELWGMGWEQGDLLWHRRYGQGRFYFWSINSIIFESWEVGGWHTVFLQI